MSFGLKVSSTPRKSAQVHLAIGFFVSAAAPAGIAIAITRASWPSFIGCSPQKECRTQTFYHQRAKRQSLGWAMAITRSNANWDERRGSFERRRLQRCRVYAQREINEGQI